jgi:hypothetical protein
MSHLLVLDGARKSSGATGVLREVNDLIGIISFIARLRGITH